MGDGTKERTGAPGNEADQFEELVETDPVEALESQEENRQGRLEEELASTKDQLMRLAAEFENFKKRMEREQSRLVKYAGENILRDL